MSYLLGLILTGWVFIHLSIALLIANPSSFVVRRLAWISAYASQLGFNTSWNFFSPDPAHPMFFRFRVYFADEEQDPIEGYWPPLKDQVITSSSLRRTMYAMRYFVVSSSPSGELFFYLAVSALSRSFPGVVGTSGFCVTPSRSGSHEWCG